MGYGSYSTPMGPAGYNVEDVCHEPGCTEEIDRGLGCLCGDQPGYATEYGCGRWFCGEHLFGLPEGVPRQNGEGMCRACVAAFESKP